MQQIVIVHTERLVVHDAPVQIPDDSALEEKVELFGRGEQHIEELPLGQEFLLSGHGVGQGVEGDGERFGLARSRRLYARVADPLDREIEQAHVHIDHYAEAFAKHAVPS